MKLINFANVSTENGKMILLMYLAKIDDANNWSHWEINSLQLIGQICILAVYFYQTLWEDQPPLQKNTDIIKLFYFSKTAMPYNLDYFFYDKCVLTLTKQIRWFF